MHQKRHQPLHQVQPLQQPQQPLPRHTSVNRHGVVVALEDDDLDLLQVRMICNVQWVKLSEKHTKILQSSISFSSSNNQFYESRISISLI